MTLGDDSEDRRAFALPGSQPHYGPDKIVDVESIDLDLHPDLETQTLSGTCTTVVRALDEDVERLSLDAVDLDVASVERDGSAAPFKNRNGKLTVEFRPPIRAGERATFAVRYRTAKPRHGLFFVEPTPAHPQRPPHAWTQSQDENARFWFPCLDYPHAKQRTSQTITVPRGCFALGNGALVERRDDGDSTVFRYVQDVPHSTYLVTMVVGPFAEVAQGKAGKNGAPVYYYVLPGREEDGERAFGNTPRMIDAFEERTGVPYPYARYSQIAVADFIFGGMENTSATTQTDRTLHDAVAHLDFSSDPLVSHELAHQWFGDLLTCRDWSHAWLNEGFATFFEAIWRETDLGYDEYLYDVFLAVKAYLEEDAERYRRPIVYNHYRDPIEIFDRHLYQKGAAVLHMLRGELGEARFWRAIRHYAQRNAGRNVETIDLVRAIEEATGRNMRGFFDQWVFRGGHPELEVGFAWDERRKLATVTIDQKQTIDAAHPPFRFDASVGFVPDAEGSPAPDAGPEALPNERRIRVSVKRARESIALPLEFEPKLVRFDPGAFVLADVTYRLEPQHAAAALSSDPDVVARIRAARALARDGSRDAVEALQSAFSTERSWGVLAEAAVAIGATHAPWARQLLIAGLGHEHPKVRAAAAAALGNFRDAETATALRSAGESDASYFVRAAAWESLGKTRDPAAFDALVAASKGRSWNGTVEAGAVRGLAELSDARAFDAVVAAGRPDREEGVRRAAAAAIGRIGELVETQRSRAVAALDDLLDDRAFLVQLAALRAAESLGDARLLPALERVAATAFDGRTRRDAAEALIRVREAGKVPAQVSGLRDDVDRLRAEQSRLQQEISTLPRT